MEMLMRMMLAALLGAAGLTAGGLPRANPEDVGLSAAALQAAVSVYQEAVERDEHRGAVILVARRGKVVLHEAVGWRDEARKEPMRKDALFKMASNTKPTIATAILMLAEEDKLELNGLVRQHIPAFDNYRSGWIQIRHLLSHTSGFRIEPIFLLPMAPGTTLLKEVAKFGEIGAEEIPGTTYSYSNPGFNTLGALVEKASGMPLDQFLAQRLYAPLGMSDSLNHESKADRSRMSVVWKKDDHGGWVPAWKPDDEPDYPIVRASGGMISTAEDYVRFFQMWLNGGILDGKRLLKEESVKAAWTPAPNTATGPEDARREYGYGFAHYPDGGWGHSGSDGTFGVAYPEDELIVLLFGQTRSPTLGDLNSRALAMIKAGVRD
ncbi:MAG: serine hydrolase [Acidobacteria bacterium]|nr:serine hydrolase [Acidobacteriota bacterium]